MGHFSNVLYDAYPDATRYAGIAFGVSWVAQFIGHGAVRFFSLFLLLILLDISVLMYFVLSV
jgi:hypothetical protein